LTLPLAAVCGLASLRLTDEERALFLRSSPAGFILFRRNCECPTQVRALVASLKSLFPERWVPVLIDQEGGRVQRLTPPHWPRHRPPRDIGKLAETDLAAGCEAAALRAHQIAAELLDVGIDVVCAPVLDLLLEETTSAIGDRAFSADPAICATLGRVSMHSLSDRGVVPVIKHLPGHGRGTVDSHEQLPVVDIDLATWRRSDAVPFLACGDAPMAMTAHIRMNAIDPKYPATQSRKVIDQLIRGEIGFRGILLSDDLSMQALAGGIGERAAAALDAGCDLALHCNGEFDELRTVLSTVPPLDRARHQRLQELAPAGGRRSDHRLADGERLDALLHDV